MIITVIFILILIGINLIPYGTQPEYPKLLERLTKVITIMSLVMGAMLLLSSDGLRLKSGIVEKGLTLVLSIAFIIYLAVERRLWHKGYP